MTIKCLKEYVPSEVPGIAFLSGGQTEIEATQNLNEINKTIKKLPTNQFVIKAQIHAGGSGKAGGIKMVKNFKELKKEAENMLGKTLITHQTGKSGRKVKRLYIAEATDISKEFY